MESIRDWMRIQLGSLAVLLGRDSRAVDLSRIEESARSTGRTVTRAGTAEAFPYFCHFDRDPTT